MEHTTLSAERLNEIRARITNLLEVQAAGPANFSDLRPSQLRQVAMAYAEDVPALLAEVERLRALAAEESDPQ